MGEKTTKYLIVALQCFSVLRLIAGRHCVNVHGHNHTCAVKLTTMVWTINEALLRSG